MRRVAAAAAVAASWLVMSCATPVPIVSDDGAALESNQGVIFGRISVWRDGQPVIRDSYRNMVSPEVVAFLSPFESIKKLKHNERAGGKWALRAHLTDGGYFSTTLPAGKYHFVEFSFLDVTRELIALRTYNPNAFAIITRPMVVTFEVLPGKTTYMGTLLFKVDTDGVRYPTYTDWTMDLVDESGDVTQWFRTQHPRITAVETQLAQKTDMQ